MEADESKGKQNYKSNRLIDGFSFFDPHNVILLNKNPGCVSLVSLRLACKWILINLQLVRFSTILL